MSFDVPERSADVVPALRPLRWTDPTLNTPGAMGALGLPVGTVTFLVADMHPPMSVEQVPNDPVAVADPHVRALVHEAVAAHSGVVPSNHLDADGVLAGFSRASDAVAAALAAQRALCTTPPAGSGPHRLRIAIHTGEAQIREDASYVGLAVVRAERLRDIAHEGQVLVSSASRDLAVDQLGDQISLLDLGEHRLADLARPERVFQLTHPELPSEFPALRSIDATPNNLPLHLSTFIGREVELAALCRLVDGNRLVTVTGTGGAGKTRIAAQAAANMVDRFPDGVWWLELAPLSESAEVDSALASALGVPGNTLTNLVERRLAAARCLIVLDNCEHLAADVAALASTVLADCPQVSVLATSRRVLDLPGEVTWRVPPLTLPPKSDYLRIDQVARCDAVRVFSDRARRARPEFVLDTTNSAAIADICERLDGLPLAIELAAARTKSMSAQQIRDGLSDALQLLTGGSPLALPRHQTLEASIQWSVALLEHPERELLRRLGVFSGSFSLSAVHTVCAGAGVSEFETHELLDRLIDHSLVVVSDVDGGRETRFALLDTVRQFARRLIDEAGESDRCSDLHAAYVRSVVSSVAPRAETSSFLRVIATLDRDSENLKAALTHLQARRDVEGLAALCLDAAPYWELGKYPGDGERWITRALDLIGDRPTATRARLLARRGEIRLALGELSGCVDDCHHAIELGEALDDDLAAGRGSWTLAAVTGYLDLEAWRALSARSIELLDRAGDHYAAADARLGRTGPLLIRGFITEGREALDAARSAIDETGHPGLAASWHARDAWAAAFAGHLVQALDAANAALDATGTALPTQTILGQASKIMATALLGLNDPLLDQCHAMALTARREGSHLAAWLFISGAMDIALLRNDLASALELSETALAWSSGLTPLFDLFPLTVGLEVALAHGDLQGLEERIDAVVAIADSAQAPFIQLVLARQRSVMHSLRMEPNAAERAAHEAISLAWRNGIGVHLAEAFEALAVAEVTAGDHVVAARILGMARAMKSRTGLVARTPALAAAVDAAITSCRTTLGDESFVAAIDEGRALDDDAAIEIVRRTRGERKRPSYGWDSLTPTELAVVDRVRRGLSNKAIAAELLMGAETVKSHMSHIFTKLDVNTRTKVAAMAAERRGAV